LDKRFPQVGMPSLVFPAKWYAGDLERFIRTYGVLQPALQLCSAVSAFWYGAALMHGKALISPRGQQTIEGCAAIDLDGGLSALGYQLSARIRWGHSLRRVQ
jgi:hypothetical protein